MGEAALAGQPFQAREEVIGRTDQGADGLLALEQQRVAGPGVRVARGAEGDHDAELDLVPVASGGRGPSAPMSRVSVANGSSGPGAGAVPPAGSSAPATAPE